MKWLFRLFLFLLPAPFFAQVCDVNSYRTNEKIKGIPVSVSDSLSRQITASYTTDIDKVRAIFRWITENIEYNVQPWRNVARKTPLFVEDVDDTGALKPLSERVAEGVLKSKTAFCDGYSRLFKTLCDYAGIRSEVVSGYADGGSGRRRLKFSSNHRWNAVCLDSIWYLLDVTWASGYIALPSDEYVKHYNDYYFLTPARDFIRDHYPEDLHWTLLSQPPVVSEFNHSPFKSNAFKKSNIFSYKPEKGVINAFPGDTIQVELETGCEDKRLFVVDTPFVDSAVIAVAALPDSSKQTCKVTGDKVIYKYIITSPTVEWLNVVFNDEVIMRYKLNIKNKDTVAK